LSLTPPSSSLFAVRCSEAPQEARRSTTPNLSVDDALLLLLLPLGVTRHQLPVCPSPTQTPSSWDSNRRAGDFDAGSALTRLCRYRRQHCHHLFRPAPDPLVGPTRLIAIHPSSSMEPTITAPQSVIGDSRLPVSPPLAHPHTPSQYHSLRDPQRLIADSAATPSSSHSQASDISRPSHR
jgi:hypothetical protein